jgi:crotonobetainyl-CoA:carnitine CoA-transferase CaiB-like acyl-CoA transferase
MSVNDVLAGVRVLEVAAWTFVPAAGAVLAEWGAEVIKVEPRDGGDPQRGLVTMGLVPEVERNPSGSTCPLRAAGRSCSSWPRPAMCS